VPPVLPHRVLRHAAPGRFRPDATPLVGVRHGPIDRAAPSSANGLVAEPADRARLDAGVGQAPEHFFQQATQARAVVLVQPGEHGIDDRPPPVQDRRDPLPAGSGRPQGHRPAARARPPFHQPGGPEPVDHPDGGGVGEPEHAAEGVDGLAGMVGDGDEGGGRGPVEGGFDFGRGLDPVGDGQGQSPEQVCQASSMWQ
jgi:hypothetical protein